MSDAPERLVTSKCGKMIVTAGMKMFDSDVGYIREDLYDAERAENERLREIFQSMDDTIVARSEFFISDQECLFNLRDRIRRALETKKGPGDDAEGLGST